MSTDQIDEYEQGERVRKWLRDNGVSIIGGIGIGFAAILGFQAWQASKASHREEAARQYGHFLQAEEAGNADQAAALAESLRANYADTAYPALAALRRAAALVEAGTPEAAVPLLDAALPGVKDPALAELLALRAARVELLLGRHDAALARLSALRLPAYAAVREELMGDAHAAQGQRDEARQAYQRALTHTDTATPTRVLLELKLADAGGTTTPEA